MRPAAAESAESPPGLRLGVYVDTVYRAGQRRPGRAFTNFELYPFLGKVGVPSDMAAPAGDTGRPPSERADVTRR